MSEPDQKGEPGAPRLRFKQRHHVKSKNDFARVYREGSRARGSLMTVAVVANGLDHARLGLSIGKRCWKGAVQRNRVRRVFRESFRTSLPELPTGIDIVLIGSTPAVRPRLQETRDELVYLARKAHRRYREKLAAEEKAP